MRSKQNVITNTRFYDSYILFDDVLSQRFNIEEDGVKKYMEKMKECYTEARDLIPEWDITFQRLAHLHKRFTALKEGKADFGHFQGKDEDVVWMQVFREKMEGGADVLTKYSKISFENKKKNKGFLGKLFGIFK